MHRIVMINRQILLEFLKQEKKLYGATNQVGVLGLKICFLRFSPRCNKTRGVDLTIWTESYNKT